MITRKRVLIAIALYFAIWCLYAKFGIFLFPDRSSFAQFGDSFGAFNAFFSGLAFLGVIAAILLQRDQLITQQTELSLQRHELEMTREVMQGQKSQLEEQARTMSKDSFEGTFFRLLALLKNSSDNVRFQGKDGHIAFEVFWKSIIDKSDLLSDRQLTKSKKISLYNRIQSCTHFDNIEVFPYFRTLKALLLFLESSSVENKRFYGSLIRAQFSEYEALVVHIFLLRFTANSHPVFGELESISDELGLF